MSAKKYTAIVFFIPGSGIACKSYHNVQRPAMLLQWCQNNYGSAWYCNLYNPNKPKHKNYVRREYFTLLQKKST